LGRTKLWLPPAAYPPGVASIYEWRTTDGAIRQGTHILNDIHKDGELLVYLKTTSGNVALHRKRDVIATFALGERPKPLTCFNCGGLIGFESVGSMDCPSWPAHLKWLPKNLYHGDTCLERLMAEFPIHSERDPIGSPNGWINVGPHGKRTRVRCGLGKKTLFKEED
jgi:hypothetical protein